MTQVAGDALEGGREAAHRHAWDDAYRLLRDADEGGRLEPPDVELLAQAALWTGAMDEASAYFERSYREHVASGAKRRAAYAAVRLAHEYRNKLQPAIASGWLGRAKRILDEDEEETAEHGYYALELSLVALFQHDFERAVELGKRAEEIGRRAGDRNLEILGIQRQGAALVTKGDVDEGRMLLDEASAAALSGELDPYSTLVVFCNTIGACRDAADYDAAGEWTERADEFCRENADSAFPGLCRVNRAEVMRFRGRLAEAHDLAGQAGEELRAWCPRIAGAAFYELGEIRLRLGELDQAEHAFREADEYGATSEPGLSLLRLARGSAKAAYSSIGRALADESLGVPTRARLLAAGVEIGLAAGELERADAWAAELAESARAYRTSALAAASAFARGSVKLAQGDRAGAFTCFREARRSWDAAGATYDVARAREGMGRAARAEGDEEAALWELQAAAARFERLGATRDAERVADLLMRDPATSVMKTFLFTDIVKSTDLLTTIEDRHWVNALRRHDDALRATFGDFGGEVVDHTGDGFFVAFDEPAQAVDAAVAAQRAVDQEFVFDIRIGIHTDGALRSGENYRGRGVHAAARIGAAAAGREILASSATMATLPRFEVENQRRLTLKGFPEPVDVCSIVWR